MKNSWAQPSLSRDFALLSAAILFVLCIISAWVTYNTYTHHSERVANELEKEAIRIERTLATEMENANYMLTALGKQIVLEQDRSLVKMAQILKSFDSKGYIYTILSWLNPDQHLVVSSNKGVLEKPVDMSDRDYMKKVFTDPWKMIIGRPVEGRVSGRWVIPVAMGITDNTGKYIGTFTISIDINTLTSQISNLVRRDGISFAIVSKTLIPLTQVSDDPDFVNHNFPIQKLVNVNFTDNPSKLISQGSMFWGTGNYAYYRVSDEYPYIILLGYDTHYSDETVHTFLWSRLLQMLAMALFFVLFLWFVRVRMIKPVMDMTNIVAAVARGEPHTPLPRGGSIELEALAAQIRRIGEYIDENKRIQSELHNKMHSLKHAKDQAEIEKRGCTEFMAHICQEMRTPLNTIIGGAQVMKDQLYGPLENRKYRQYAADIYNTGNSLLDNTQNLLTLAKAETHYVTLNEKPVDVMETIHKALAFVNDKVPTCKSSVKLHLPESLPKLSADEFRLQQIIMNLVLHALSHIAPDGTIEFESRAVNENRDKAFFVFILRTTGYQTYTQAELVSLAEHLSQPQPYRPTPITGDPFEDQTDIGLELARMLIAMHGGIIDIKRSSENAFAITVLFPGSRIHHDDRYDR